MEPDDHPQKEITGYPRKHGPETVLYFFFFALAAWIVIASIGVLL
jgi:hypothetical protein